MNGDNQVIQHLNILLAGELTAIDQYFIHSRMYENWGFSKLYERIAHEVQDETSHATALIKRILFLEGTPDLSKREPLHVGSTVPEMLKNDLALELSVVAALREVIAYCETVQDYQTREILLVMLKDTEDDHTHWLEKQLGMVEKIGLQNYLQSQI
ncbi:MAG: bacterioferritin [Methylococcaceae bacterium]|nr:bacterioferritin [Methylococcaceae bacterium]MDZ4156465.1 bacterioferritin [Methylococcales bacterium]MDP2391681.1 bacterioferritin [Methylococcaceae bacterium]MDP3018181.1 bacterioferritin [Methylococcaceae bacterium]MDP3389393.1 bacterioferritin [Methylococcaceae bacterium]